MPKPKIVPLTEYNLRQQIEILTNQGNSWETGEKLGHQPNPSIIGDRNALCEQWIKSGRRGEFRTRFAIRVPMGARFILAIKSLPGTIRWSVKRVKNYISLEAKTGSKQLVHAQ